MVGLTQPSFEINFFFLRQTIKSLCCFQWLWNNWSIVYHLPQIAHFLHGITSGWKQGPDAMQTADSSLQPGCTGSGPAVSLPQSFFLPKEFRQSRDQFSRQTSKLCLSHLTHTLFFFLEGMTMMSSKDTSTPGSQLSHWGDLLSVSRRQCSAWNTHTGSHTHADWRVQMHIVMLKNKSAKTHVHTHKHSKHDAFSHIVTQVGDYLHKYREQREPEIAEM